MHPAPESPNPIPFQAYDSGKERDVRDAAVPGPLQPGVANILDHPHSSEFRARRQSGLGFRVFGFRILIARPGPWRRKVEQDPEEEEHELDASQEPDLQGWLKTKVGLRV